MNDKLPDKTLHYVPFTYAGTVSAYTLLQAMVPTESEMEYEHSLFISEYNITHTVSWNELNKKDLIFRNLTEYNGVPYYIHAPSGGARYDTGPFNNEWQRIFEKNSGFIKNSYDMVEADGIVSTQDSWCQDTNPNATREFRVVRSGGGSGFYSYPPDRATRMTAYRPVLEIALAYGMEYPQNYMKAVTLNLNGGSVGGNTGDISIVVKNIEVLDPSYPAVTFLAPTKEGLTRPDGNTGTYFMWRGDNGELYAPGDAVPNEVNSLTALWVEHGHCVCGGDADFDGHTSHTAVEWTAWDKTDSLPTTAGNYYLKNDILIDGQFEINESVNICLNGKKIRAGSSIPENRYMLTVKGSNALTITDCGGKRHHRGCGYKRYHRHTGRNPHYVRGNHPGLPVRRRGQRDLQYDRQCAYHRLPGIRNFSARRVWKRHESLSFRKRRSDRLYFLRKRLRRGNPHQIGFGALPFRQHPVLRQPLSEPEYRGNMGR